MEIELERDGFLGINRIDEKLHSGTWRVPHLYGHVVLDRYLMSGRALLDA